MDHLGTLKKFNRRTFVNNMGELYYGERLRSVILSVFRDLYSYTELTPFGLVPNSHTIVSLFERKEILIFIFTT